MQSLKQHYLSKGMTYRDYRDLIKKLLQQNKTTGPNSSKAMVYYTSLNDQRMQRLDNTIQLLPALKDKVSQVNQTWNWVILTEAWCGDAAQIVPVIEKIASLNDRITTHYLLRDENPELMDQYLTRGGRAIPKLICYDSNSGEAVFSWGPRPAPAQELFWEMHDKGIPHSDIIEEVQKWYNSDKLLTLQKEFLTLLQENI